MDSVWIFDLDGTILTGNSFHHWVRYLLVGHFKGLTLVQRVWLRCSTIWALILRKLWGHSHAQLKRSLQHLWAEALEKDGTQQVLTTLVAQLRAQVRPNMQQVLDHVAASHVPAILATAAAGEYAQALGAHLGFKHSLVSSSHLHENRGEQKRDSVLAYLLAHSLQDKKRVFFTDHEDDLPLMQQSNIVLWLGADEAMQAVAIRAPGVAFTACRNVDATRLLQLALA